MKHLFNFSLIIATLALYVSAPFNFATTNAYLVHSPSASVQYVNDTPADFISSLKPIGSCFNASEALEFDWFAPSVVNEVYPKIILESPEWLSAQLINWAYAIILRDLMNHKNITLVNRQTDLSRYPSPVSIFTRLSLSQTHFYPETWMSYYYNDPEKVGGLVDTSLSIGYQGLEGLYVLPSLLSKFSNTEAPEYYRVLKKPSVWSVLESAGNTSVASVCDLPICAPLGIFRTSLCKASPSDCKLVLHATKDWSPSIIENILENNNFNAELKYPVSYDSMKDTVIDRQRRGIETIFYSWEPDPFPEKINATRVVFKRNAECGDLDNGVSIVPGHMCDLDTFELKKSIWRGLETYDQAAYLLAKQISFTLPSIKGHVKLCGRSQAKPI